MKGIHDINNIYFLGIGGIGMSALARYFNAMGKNVAGYDRAYTPLTKQLTTEGISIHYEDSLKLIPQEFKSPVNTWVVLTPAIPADSEELAYFRKQKFTIFKRSEILGQVTRERKTVAVAGTHGKTTVSTMISYIMSESRQGCNAFLGGISKNFSSNLVLNPQSNWVVTEADEYDRSFLQLHPYAAVVTAMDADHLDIYGNENAMQESFNAFVSQIDRQGILLMKAGIPVHQKNKPARSFTYSLNGPGDFYAANIRLEKGRYTFDLKGPGTEIRNLSLEHPGLVNVENAVAAGAISQLLGLDHDQIRIALHTFSGIQRRFDFQVKTENVVYIDDYAHHPKEIEATLKSVRQLYPGKKITGVFQPHLYTRTRDFADGFAESLGLLDKLILLEIYPARELPIEGVSADIIFRNVAIPDKVICQKDDLLNLLMNSTIEVLITLGAGDIDRYVTPITNMLLKKMEA